MNATDRLPSYMLLLQIMVPAKHRLMLLAERYGLTLMQANVLALMESDDPRPTNSLCGVLHCDPSNVTGLVDRLEKMGALARTDNPQDRRVKMISLTPQGRKIREELIGELIAAEEERLSVLTLAESAMLRQLLEKIINSERLVDGRAYNAAPPSTDVC